MTQPYQVLPPLAPATASGGWLMTPTPLLIYIAGPYSADVPADVSANVERAMLAGWRIIDRGHFPVIPHLAHWFDVWASAQALSMSYEFYLAWDMEILRRCDGLLYLAPSPGADRELALAQALGLPVWTSADDVPLMRKAGDA